jgi:hypothetical protein
MTMKMITPVALTLIGLSLLAPSHALDLNAPIDPARCQHALDRFERARHNFAAAKFALDRAIQLLGSARFASGVGMNIDLASRQSDVDAALSPYVESIGPAYGAIELLNVNCNADAVKQMVRVPASAKFKEKVDENISNLFGAGTDQLADDQMADIKRLFDSMKAGRK